MSPASWDSLTSFFPILIPFISSSSLSALTKNSKTVQGKSEKSGQLSLVSY
jgi:hypothetical protein